MNKKGISTIVGSVILIAIVFAVGAIVWGVINNTVNDSLKGTTSCNNIMGKIELNPSYICFDATGKRLVFSINIKDIEVNGMLISLSKSGATKSIEFIDGVGPTNSEDITLYPSGGATELPGENEGLTYVYNTTGTSFETGVDLIEIAPKIDGNQCSTIDSISNIPTCVSMGITFS